MIVKPYRAARMCTTAARLTYDSCALEVLEVKRELFGSRERVIARQDVNVLIGKLHFRHIGLGPEFVGLVVLSPVEVVQVHGLIAEEIRADEGDHRRAAAAIL